MRSIIFSHVGPFIWLRVDRSRIWLERKWGILVLRVPVEWLLGWQLCGVVQWLSQAPLDQTHENCAWQSHISSYPTEVLHSSLICHFIYMVVRTQSDEKQGLKLQPLLLGIFAVYTKNSACLDASHTDYLSRPAYGMKRSPFFGQVGWATHSWRNSNTRLQSRRINDPVVCSARSSTLSLKFRFLFSKLFPHTNVECWRMSTSPHTASYVLPMLIDFLWIVRRPKWTR